MITNKWLFICCVLFPHMPNSSYPALTQGLDGSRLGDQLLSYMHTKWASYKYGVPFFYKPFPYSDQLALHYQEKRFDQVSTKNWPERIFKPHQNLDDFLNINAVATLNILYTIPYFPECPEEHLPVNPPYNVMTWNRPAYPYFKVEWDNVEFKKLLQGLVSPTRPLNLVTPPKNKVSVAIHVRIDNGGYDRPLLHSIPDTHFNPQQLYNDVVFPLKHPPFEYYTDQLKKIIALFPNTPLYVYLFTDDPNPPGVMQRFQKEFPQQNIEFACRTTENNHYSNVLEDLFSMMQFDCLIRPNSNLSIVASKLGNFKVVISPAHHHWERKLVIDQVTVQTYM